jgi:hypothetical protein
MNNGETQSAGMDEISGEDEVDEPRLAGAVVARGV